MTKHSLIVFLFCCVGSSACTPIRIEEQSFLRSRSQAVLHYLIREGASTSAELAKNTAYPIPTIEHTVAQLAENGSLILEDGSWALTQTYRTKQADYISSIEQFSATQLNSKHKLHDFVQESLSEPNLAIAGFIAKNPSETLLFFGGNGFTLIPQMHALERFLEPQRNVFSLDYPGMGESEGPLTVASLTEAAERAFKHIANKTAVSNTTLIVYGFSMGGFVATHIASTFGVDGLILDSTAPDIQSWVNASLPFYAKPFVKLDIDANLLVANNADAISSITCPILLIAGADDAITPPALMAQLRDSAKKSSHTDLRVLDQTSHGKSIDHKSFASLLDAFFSVSNNVSRSGPTY